MPRPRWSALAAVLVAVVFLAALAGCTDDPESEQLSFCDQLRAATGPLGAEVGFGDETDPDRFDAVLAELNGLLEVAPDEITDALTTTIELFELRRQTPRDEVIDVLADRQVEMTEASTALSTYALDECGVLLFRAAPTPIAETDIDEPVAPE